MLESLLVFCNVTNKIHKHKDNAVAFTQGYSRVSYPLRNVSTLSTGSGSSKDTHRRGEDRREDFLDLESMPRRRDHVTVILRATGLDWLIQADSSSNSALSNIRTWRITRAQIGLSHPASYLYKPWDYWTTEWYSPA